MEQKRTRVSMACELCRSKKLKCDGGEPSCSRCLHFGVQCNYTEIPKKNGVSRKQAKPRKKRKVQKKPAKTDVTDLDTRMRRLETLMTSILEKMDPETAHDHSETQSDESTPASTVSFSDSYYESVGKIGDTSPRKMHINKYWGPQNTFSLLSSRGIQRLSKLSGDPNLLKQFENLHHKITGVFLMTNNMWLDPVEKSQLRPLPDRDTSHALIDRVFSDFLFVSLFLKKSEVQQLFDRYYRMVENPGLYGEKKLSNSDLLTMNVLLSIGAILFMTVENKPDSPENRRLQTLQLNHIQNAIYYFHRVSVISEGIRTIQAFILLTVYSEFIRGFPQSYILVSTLVRFAQEMGLHRSESYVGLSPEEAAMRRRIWLCVFMFDRDCCFKTGKPFIIHQEDVSSVLPEQFRDAIFEGFPRDIVNEIFSPGYDLVGALSCMTTEEYCVNPHRLLFAYFHCHVVNFISFAYSELYSATSLKNLSVDDVMWKIDRLNDKLDRLIKYIPQCVNPNLDFSSIKDPLIKREIRLAHMQYYSCVILVNKLAFTKSWLAEDAEFAHQPSELQSKLITKCLNAARILMAYVRDDDHLNPLSSNHASFHFLSAFFTLFTAIIEYPSSPHVKDDLELISTVKADLLSKHAVHCLNTGDTITYNVINYCVRVFIRIALLVYNKANNANIDLTNLDNELRHFDNTLEKITKSITRNGRITNQETLQMNPRMFVPAPVESPCQFAEMNQDSLNKSSLFTQQDLQAQPMYEDGINCGSNGGSDIDSPFLQDLFTNGEFSLQSHLLNQYTMADFEAEKNSTVLQHMFAIPNVFLNTNDLDTFNHIDLENRNVQP